MDIYCNFTKISISEEAREKYAKFKIKPHDVIINTPAKCGTTWLQMICHSLRSNGDMSFDDMEEMIPFVLASFDAGIQPEVDQGWKPQMYKYHDAFEALPTADDVKYILCIRNPIDVAISNYYFMKHWMLPDEVTLEDYVEKIYLQDKDPVIKNIIYIWNAILNFYPRRHDPNVLFLHYEDLKENLRQSVKLIANFLEIDADDDLIDLVTSQADIKFMLKNRDKFSFKRTKKSVNKNLDLDPNKGSDERYTGLVRVGGCGQKISTEIDMKFERKWKMVIEKELGFKSYHEFRKATNKELNRPFNT